MEKSQVLQDPQAKFGIQIWLQLFNEIIPLLDNVKKIELLPLVVNSCFYTRNQEQLLYELMFCPNAASFLNRPWGSKIFQGLWHILYMNLVIMNFVCIRDAPLNCNDIVNYFIAICQDDHSIPKVCYACYCKSSTVLLYFPIVLLVITISLLFSGVSLFQECHFGSMSSDNIHEGLRCILITISRHQCPDFQGAQGKCVANRFSVDDLTWTLMETWASSL